MEYARVTSVRLSSLAHSTEDVDKVVRAILNICPKELSGRVRTDTVKGHYGNSITRCHIVFAGESKANRFFNHLWGSLSSLDRTRLYNSAEDQIDESDTLHVRLDKQEALRGRITLRDDEPVKVEILFKGWNRKQPIAEQVKTRMITPCKVLSSYSPEES